MRTLQTCLIVLLLLVSGRGVPSRAGKDSLVVKTEHGRVRGKRVGKAHAFLGIPYAGPPVGDLRWRPPVPSESWSEIRDAQSYPTAAAQRMPNPTGVRKASEDCLYLNVLVPVTRSADKPLLVMTYVHGGSTVSASSCFSLSRADQCSFGVAGCFTSTMASDPPLPATKARPSRTLMSCAPASAFVSRNTVTICSALAAELSGIPTLVPSERVTFASASAHAVD